MAKGLSSKTHLNQSRLRFVFIYNIFGELLRVFRESGDNVKEEGRATYDCSYPLYIEFAIE